MKFLHFICVSLILSCSAKDRLTVTTLNLSNKNLTLIPDSVFSMTQLEHLELGNNFTIYPPLSILGEDSLQNMNKIPLIPKEISKLRRLQFLGLRFIELRSLPFELIQLDKLDSLDISFNQNFDLASHYEIFSKLQWLKYLNIFATKADYNTIARLRMALPNTRIMTNFEDIRIGSAGLVK